MYAATVAAAVAPDRKHVSSRRRGRRPVSALAPIGLFALVTAALIAAGAAPTLADRGSAVSPGTRTVRVAQAASLWSIAQANAVPGVTTAETVRRIRDLNGLEPADRLQPGAVLRVPCVEVADTAFASVTGPSTSTSRQ